jgi:hypothetical protein
MIRLATWTLAAMGLAATAAMAQPRDHHTDRMIDQALENVGDGRDVVEIMMMVRLSRELELTEEETVLLVRRMADFREDYDKLHRERRAITGQLREAMAQDAGDEALRAKLDELKTLDERMHEARAGLHEKLSEGLSEQQRVRIYMFLQDFEQNMARMVQRVRERSRMMDGGRGGRDGMRRGFSPGGRDGSRGLGPNRPHEREDRDSKPEESRRDEPAR